MLTRYNDDGNLVAWVRPLDSDAMAELESAHCYAAEFGTVLEWCTTATDDLFTGAPSMSRNRRHAGGILRRVDAPRQPSPTRRSGMHAGQSRRLGGEAA